MGWDYVSHVLASPAPLYGRLQQACQAVRQEPLVGLLEYVPPFVRLIDCQLRAYSVDALLRYAAEAMPRQPHQVSASVCGRAGTVQQRWDTHTSCVKTQAKTFTLSCTCSP